MQLLEHIKELTLLPKNVEVLKGLILQLAVQGKLTQKWREEHPDVEPASVLLERINKEKERLVIDPDYIVLTLKSSQIRKLLLGKMNGMASSQVNISQSNIKGICFPMPTFVEQKAIVGILPHGLIIGD